MSAANLVKVGVTAFAVGAAIGAGLHTYFEVRRRKMVEEGKIPPTMDEAEAAIHDIAKKHGANVVDINIAR